MMDEETQDVETPEGDAEPQISDDWAPYAHVAEPWMMEKYRTPDEFIKSGAASRRQQTEAEQRARDLEKHVQDMHGYTDTLEKKLSQYEGQPQNTQQQGRAQQGFDYAALIRQTGGLINQDGTDVDAEKLAAIMEVSGLVQQQTIAQMVAEQLAAAIGTYDQERVGPIASRAEQEAAASELAELEDLYGEDFETVYEIAEKLHDDNPGIRQAGGLKALFGLASTDLQKQRTRLRTLEARGYTIDEGGRPKPPPARKTVEEEQLEAIESYARRRGDRGVV